MAGPGSPTRTVPFLAPKVLCPRTPCWSSVTPVRQMPKGLVALLSARAGRQTQAGLVVPALPSACGTAAVFSGVPHVGRHLTEAGRRAGVRLGGYSAVSGAPCTNPAPRLLPQGDPGNGDAGEHAVVPARWEGSAIRPGPQSHLQAVQAGRSAAPPEQRVPAPRSVPEGRAQHFPCEGPCGLHPPRTCTSEGPPQLCKWEELSLAPVFRPRLGSAGSPVTRAECQPVCSASHHRALASSCAAFV